MPRHSASISRRNVAVCADGSWRVWGREPGAGGRLRRWTVRVAEAEDTVTVVVVARAGGVDDAAVLVLVLLVPPQPASATAAAQTTATGVGFIAGTVAPTLLRSRP
jgi:hypothetical protein